VAGWRGTPATVIRTLILPVVLPAGEEPLPQVCVAGTEFEITLTGKPLDEGEGYALTDPDGVRLTTSWYTAVDLRPGSGLLRARITAYRGGRAPEMLGGDGREAMFLEDGAGGLIPVLRDSTDYREAESDALWANGWDPRLYFEDDAVIEIPDTPSGWAAARLRVLTRLRVYADRAPVTVTTPYGVASLTASVPDSPVANPLHVMVRGDIAAGRLTYRLQGEPANVAVKRKDNGLSATRSMGDRVRAAVQAAFDTDRGRPGASDLRALYTAYRPLESWCHQLTMCAEQGVDPGVQPYAKDYRQSACDALLRLGALTFPENTSELTDRMIRNGFDGTVQDLYGAVTALLSAPVAPPRA